MILLGVCSYDAKIHMSLIPFLFEAAPYVTFLPITHTATDRARNQIIAAAQRRGLHCIMADADSAPAPGTFLALKDKIESEVCVAACPHVAAGGQICAAETSPSIQAVEHLTGWQPTDNCSTHVVGYNIEVFDNITKPYYYYETNDDNTALPKGAEDSVLHRRLHAAGIPIYVDFGHWAGHMITKEMGKPSSLTKEMAMLLLAGAA